MLYDDKIRIYSTELLMQSQALSGLSARSSLKYMMNFSSACETCFGFCRCFHEKIRSGAQPRTMTEKRSVAATTISTAYSFKDRNTVQSAWYASLNTKERQVCSHFLWNNDPNRQDGGEDVCVSVMGWEKGRETHSIQQEIHLTPFT